MKIWPPSKSETAKSSYAEPISHVRLLSGRPKPYDQDTESNDTPIRQLATPPSEALHYDNVIDITEHIKVANGAYESDRPHRLRLKLRQFAKRVIEISRPIEYEPTEEDSSIQ